jgi:hypothetical protein
MTDFFLAVSLSDSSISRSFTKKRLVANEIECSEITVDKRITIS